MDLGSEQLQFLSISNIVKESISIPKQSPKTFSLITLTLIFPLSVAILAQSRFTDSMLKGLLNDSTLSSSSFSSSDWAKLLLYQLLSLISLFAFSLLSTAAVVFTLACLYTSKPVSFSHTLAAIPSVFKRLFITFLFVTIAMAAYSVVFEVFLVLLAIAVVTKNVMLFLFSLVVVSVLALGVHIYISAWWHLASVVSVLEPVYGYAAMKKSYELLKGKAGTGYSLVFDYLAVCGMINLLFRLIVVDGGDWFGVMTRIIVGVFLVGFLVVVNLIGLLVQSVFYYVCKSYHHQEIDKTALYDHLGGYLGEYVPLKSSVEMHNLDV